MSSSPARSLLNNRDAFTDVLSRAASGAGLATGDGSTGGRPPRGGSTDDLRGHQAGGAVVHSSGRSAGGSRPPPPPRSPPGVGPVARFIGGDGSSSSASLFGRVEEALRLTSSAEAALQAHPPESTRSRDGGASHQALEAANQRVQAAQSRVAVERQERERLAATLAQCQTELRAAQAEVARLQREQLAAMSARRRGGGGEEDDGDVEATIGSLLEMLASEQALRSDMAARLAQQQQQQLDSARADSAPASDALASSEQLLRLQPSEEQRERAVSDALSFLADLRATLAACLSDLDSGAGGATPRTPPGAGAPDSATALAGKQRFVLWLAAERKKREEAERRLDDATEELARSEHSRREATQRWLEVASQLSTVAAVAPGVAAAAAGLGGGENGGGGAAMQPAFSFASTVRALTPPHAFGAHANGSAHGDEDGDGAAAAMAAGAGLFGADLRHRDRGRPRGSPDGSIASARSAGRAHDGRGRAPGTAAWPVGDGQRGAAGAPLSFSTALQAAAAVVPDLLRRVVAGTMPHTAALEAAQAAAQQGHVAGEHAAGVASAALVLAALPLLWLAAWLVHAPVGGSFGDAPDTHGLLAGDGGLGPHRAGGGAAAAWGLVTGALSLFLRVLRWILQL